MIIVQDPINNMTNMVYLPSVNGCAVRLKKDYLATKVGY